MTTVSPGRYRHYKGQDYEVLCVAKHEETGEDLVIYQALYGTRQIWARPIAVFRGAVTLDQQTLPRFQKIVDA